jgi:GDP-D-mannose 3', 5'-epimerase
MKKIVVLGAGGFIGGHLVTRLKKDGHWVCGVDIKYHEFKKSDADEFIIADLRDPIKVDVVIDNTIDEVYQLAADMGGAGFIFTGENDFDIMHNSAMINLNVCDVITKRKVKKIFYSSSACIYPEYNQLDQDNPKCDEESAYPAAPDSEYGWEKLFSERLYFTLMRNKGIKVKVARFHNIFGPMGTYQGGREKAPAAMCRKAIESVENETLEIEVWGDGKQTRSFLYIDECIDGIIKLMECNNFNGPVNIGSDEMVSINYLAKLAIGFTNKDIKINNVDVKQVGVRGRNSDNNLILKKLNWKPQEKLADGLLKTFNWIQYQIRPSTSGSPNH